MTKPSLTSARADRQARLSQALVRSGIDAVVVTWRTDIQWLTGFTGSAGAVLVMADGHTTLATDDRYAQAVREASPGLALHVTRTPLMDLAGTALAAGARVVGMDGADLSWRRWNEVSTSLGESAAVQDFATVIGDLRCRKDAVEIDALRRACRITDEAVTAVLGELRPGVTERQVARTFVRLIEDLGADGPSFPPIIAGGPNAAVPHHDPGDRAFVPGDVVILDVGAKVDGYCADMSRTFVLGEADPVLRRAHSAVAQAQSAARNAVRAGVTAGSVDAVARDAISAAGFGDSFTHGTGHGVGLDIHEAPILTKGAAGILGESFAITVEPGIYLPGIGGVRIEDIVLVGATGAETLTQLPRDLVVL